MLPEDPILLPEIIDHVFLVAVHPASGREYEEAQSVGHSLRLLGEQPLAPTLFRRFANLGRFVAPYERPTTNAVMSRPLLEFGGGSGEILRDLHHLRSVSEAEAVISGAEGRDQLRHISMSLQAPELLGRFEDAGGDPAQHHLAAPPAFNVAFDVA